MKVDKYSGLRFKPFAPWFGGISDRLTKTPIDLTTEEGLDTLLDLLNKAYPMPTSPANIVIKD